MDKIENKLNVVDKIILTIIALLFAPNIIGAILYFTIPNILENMGYHTRIFVGLYPLFSSAIAAGLAHSQVG